VTEPEYHFKRGVGWVPGPPFPTATVERGLYRLTLEQRDPNPGERWWRDESEEGPEKYIQVFSDRNGYRFDERFVPGGFGVDYESFKYYKDKTRSVFYTIVLERIK
jgi:hypothetical protein